MCEQIRFETDGILIVQTSTDHVEQLETLQKTVFPTLREDQKFSAENYLEHLRIFPEGQFVALQDSRVIGMTSTVRYTVDFEHMLHTFDDIAQGGSLASHQQDGTWLYGADMGVHPEFRRRGIARSLYHARQLLVQKLDLEGQLTVGMPNGYGSRSDHMSIEEYYTLLERDEVFDPTVSVQKSFGFALRGIIPGYVQDPICANYGILLVLDKAVVLQ